MRKRNLYLIIAGALVLVAGLAALPLFLPDDTVRLQETPDGEVSSVRGGEWEGHDSAHKASGRLDIVTVDGVPHLRFMDFSMTSGPDVFLYLTPKADTTSTSGVEGDGVRIDVRTSADPSAKLNERGDFLIELDMSLDELAAYGGATAWCDRFNQPFATVSLA